MPLLPIVECLQGAADDQARARWLLIAPTSIFLYEEQHVRRILRAAGFIQGVEALDIELAVLLAVRDPMTGDVPANLRELRDQSRSQLMITAGIAPLEAAR